MRPAGAAEVAATRTSHAPTTRYSCTAQGSIKRRSTKVYWIYWIFSAFTLYVDPIRSVVRTASLSDSLSPLKNDAVLTTDTHIYTC